MGSEFADREKRPEKQPDFGIPSHKPEPKPKGSFGTEPPFVNQHPNQKRVPDPDNPGLYKMNDWSAQDLARYNEAMANDPRLSWLVEGKSHPPTPQELLVKRYTPEFVARHQEQVANNPALSWLQDPNGKPPTPYELARMRREKREREDRQQLHSTDSIQTQPTLITSDQPPEQQHQTNTATQVVSEPLLPPQPSIQAVLPLTSAIEPVNPTLFGAAPGTSAYGRNGMVTSGMLMAQSIPFPTQGAPLLRGVPVPKIPAVPPWVIPWTIPGVSPVVPTPTVSGEAEERFLNPNRHQIEQQYKQRQHQGLSAPSPSLPSPQPSQPGVAVPGQQQQPNSQAMPQPDVQQQQWEQEQQQREREFQAQQAQFKAQQAAQKQLWAKQDKLNTLSAGFILNEEHVETFEAQLTPQQKGSLSKEVNERYKALTGLTQQADNPFEPYEVAEIKQKLRQQVLYERYVPVREINHFGNQFLNGYSPQKMQAVRGYFDQVYEGSYSKRLPADKQRAIEASADQKYVQETGQQKVDHNSPLWKTLRNVETSERFPDVWDQFRTDLNQAQDNDVKKTIVIENDPNLGSNAINRPGQGASLSPELLKPESFPSGGESLPPLGGFNTDPLRPELTKPETFPTNEKVDGVSHVFEYTTDYRKNYEKFYGPIPAGSQIHHIAPRAVFNDSDLAQEWVKRGITKLDYPENLNALPQTKDAYDKSSIKIQHSGSHGEWSKHARQALEKEQNDLIDQYGSLNKVPNNVMEQVKNKVMQDLREDLLDKDLGIDKGWVKPKSSGMDKLSQTQPHSQIG